MSPHAEQTPCAQVNASGLPAREMNESAKTFNWFMSIVLRVWDPLSSSLWGGGQSSHWSLLLGLNLLTLRAKDSYNCNWIIHQNYQGTKGFLPQKSQKHYQKRSHSWIFMGKHHSHYDPRMYPSNFQTSCYLPLTKGPYGCHTWTNTTQFMTPWSVKVTMKK